MNNTLIKLSKTMDSMGEATRFALNQTQCIAKGSKLYITHMRHRSYCVARSIISRDHEPGRMIISEKGATCSIYEYAKKRGWLIKKDSNVITVAAAEKLTKRRKHE